MHASTNNSNSHITNYRPPNHSKLLILMRLEVETIDDSGKDAQSDWQDPGLQWAKTIQN